MPPCPFAPHLSVVRLLHLLEFERAIQQRQPSTNDCRRDRHYNRDPGCRDEFSMLCAVYIYERGDDACEGIKRAWPAWS